MPKSAHESATLTTRHWKSLLSPLSSSSSSSSSRKQSSPASSSSSSSSTASKKIERDSARLVGGWSADGVVVMGGDGVAEEDGKGVSGEAEGEGAKERKSVESVESFHTALTRYWEEAPSLALPDSGSTPQLNGRDEEFEDCKEGGSTPLNEDKHETCTESEEIQNDDEGKNMVTVRLSALDLTALGLPELKRKLPRRPSSISSDEGGKKDQGSDGEDEDEDGDEWVVLKVEERG